MQKTNPNAPVRSNQEIQIKAPIKKVWSVMADVNIWDKRQSDISKAKLLSELNIGGKFTWRTGGAGINSTFHTINKPTQLGWSGKTYGMYAVHNWYFEETDNGTLVSVDENMEGFLASLFKKAFNRNLGRDMGNWLLYLKKEAEK